MISKETKDYVNKIWPNIKDNETLLKNIKKQVLDFAYIFNVPKNAEETFLEKAGKKAKSIRFAANGFGILAALTFIKDVIQNNFTVVAYIDSFSIALIAFFFRYLYKEKCRLINCYKEILSESLKTDVNQDNNVPNST